MRLLLTSVLKDEGYEVTTAGTGEEALQVAARRHFHLIISDLKMPGISGLEFLGQVKRDDPETPVIFLTAHGSVEGAVEAMRGGARDYLLKPLANPEELRLAVRRGLEERRLADEAATLREAQAAAFPFGAIIARDPKMEAVLDLARSVAPADTTVLLTGETGTGKELLARAIHHWSPRTDQAFVAVNCAALAETLAGERALRPREGGLHGRRGPAAGPFRAGPRRDPVPVGFSEDATRLLLDCAWPGNIRELQNLVERATILCRGERILPDRHGRMHMAASRITNHRTGAVLMLRDETGHPRWMGGMGRGPMGR